MEKRIIFPRLMFFIGLGFFLFLGSCAVHKPNQPEGKQMSFTDGTLGLQPTRLLVRIHYSYDSLLRRLAFVPGKILAEQKENDPFLIQLNNTPKIEYRNDKIFISDLQLIFKAKPSVLGMNAGWFQGTIKAQVSFPISSNVGPDIYFETCDYSYDWLQKPSIKVAGFSVNASSIIDKYIESKKEFISKGILDNLNAVVSAKNWLPKIQQEIISRKSAQFEWLNDKFSIIPKSFSFENRSVTGDFELRGNLGISTVGGEKANFKPLNGLIDNQLVFFTGKSSLLAMLTNLNKGKLQIDNLSIEKEGLYVETKGLLGKNSKINFTIQVYNDSQFLYLVCKNIEQEKLRFPYNLMPKRVEKRISESIEKNKIDFSQMLVNSGMTDQIGNIQLINLQSQQEGIFVIGKILNPILLINP